MRRQAEAAFEASLDLAKGQSREEVAQYFR